MEFSFLFSGLLSDAMHDVTGDHVVTNGFDGFQLLHQWSDVSADSCSRIQLVIRHVVSSVEYSGLFK